VRLYLILSLLLFGLLPLTAADTIYLKNGRSIFADSVREKNGRVEYQIGESTYAISKASVDHIDSGGMPSGSSRIKELPALSPPAEDIRHSGEVVDKVIHEGRVDEQAIAEIEKQGNSELSAGANFVAGRFEYERGNLNVAQRYLLRGLNFEPENVALLDFYVATLIALRRAQEAVPYGEEATRQSPSSADSFKLLGYAYSQADRTKEAINAWKRALQLRPDPGLQEEIAKAERELNAENNFTESETSHFTLHYEGRQSSPVLRQQILNTLESHYNELVGDLGIAPRSTISVSLYTDQAFFDITEAPSWVGALNDGKLRIPVDGISNMTPDLSRVLKHELTHSFIREITRGRCPQWLNEGVAQALEPKSTSPVGRELEQLYAEQRQIPLSSLEGAWIGFSGGQAQVAYYEALAGVEYIRDTYGMSDISRLLQRIGEGASTEVALRSTIHGGYADLEEGITSYLKKNYGP